MVRADWTSVISSGSEGLSAPVPASVEQKTVLEEVGVLQRQQKGA